MASSSQVGSSSKRPKSSEWSWWDEVELDGAYRTGGSRAWTCKYCHQRKTGSATRIRAHMLHLPGQEIAFCGAISSARREELRRKDDATKPSPSARRAGVAIDPSMYTSTRGSTISSIGGFTSVFGPTATPFGPPPTALGGRGTSRSRQTTLADRWDPKKEEEVDAAVARFFYHDAIAFQAARSGYFKNMVQKIAEYGPTYTPPTSEALRTTLLQKERDAVAAATEVVRSTWVRNGITLIADGWSDTRSRSIHGVIAYSRGQAYFISSYDASSTGKNAEQLAQEWSDAVQVVGPQNVLQFVADGEPANKAASRLLMQKYPHITFSVCMAHSLNNLLKDIGKLDWIARVIEQGNDIVTFIYRHTFLLAQFRKKSCRDLRKYSDTRFGYNFLMLASLEKCSSALKQLMVSEEYERHALSSTVIGKECAAHIGNPLWWEDLRRIVALGKPIIHLLRMTDSLQPCIGKIYEGMDKMVESLEKIEPDYARYEILRKLCQDRWNAYHSPMHAAAFTVDPQFQTGDQFADEEVADGWDQVLERLVLDAAKQRIIKDQLADYRACKRKFGRANAQADRLTTDPCVWWEDYGAETPELQQVAIKILSQAVSSSCLEQLWSTFSHIASKKRNRLATERTNNLVFVSANLRLLERFENPQEWKHWSEKKEDDSDAEDDPLSSHAGTADVCGSIDVTNLDDEALDSLLA